MIDLLYLTIICLLIVLFGGLLVSIYDRYGTRNLILTLFIALLFAFLNTQLVRLYLLPKLTPLDYDEEMVYPAEEWRKIHSTEESIEGFEFRPGQGLFLVTQSTEIQLTEEVPGCLAEGGIAQFYLRSNSTRLIQKTFAPSLTLTDPPETPIHTIYFNIPIQDSPEIDTVILGASAFVALSDGEVLCTEREVQRGQVIGVGLVFAEGMRNLAYLTLTFFLSLFFVIILSAVILKAHYQLIKLLIR